MARKQTVKRKRKHLGDYRNELPVSERAPKWGYTTYASPGKVASVTTVAKALGVEPKRMRESCEAYGRQVECYRSAPSLDGLEELSAKLRKAKIKHKVQEMTEKKNGRLMIPVTYFKAWHWDE
jgi:hypothetical protein